MSSKNRKPNSPQRNEAFVAPSDMHDRVVVRSPLGEPSPAAARFLQPEADPYPAADYVAPSEALSKSAALAQACSEAAARATADQTPGKNIARRAGDVEPNTLRLLAGDVDQLASRIRAARCLDQAEELEHVACDLREQAKAIELLALDIGEGLEAAA